MFVSSPAARRCPAVDFAERHAGAFDRVAQLFDRRRQSLEHDRRDIDRADAESLEQVRGWR